MTGGGTLTFSEERYLSDFVFKTRKGEVNSVIFWRNMAFTLWTLFEASLLCLNAICVLHEERFLVKIGWGAQQNIQGFGEAPTIKSQMLNLVRSIRTVARFPLIFLNILTIVVKMILG